MVGEVSLGSWADMCKRRIARRSRRAAKTRVPAARDLRSGSAGRPAFDWLHSPAGTVHPAQAWFALGEALRRDPSLPSPRATRFTPCWRPRTSPTGTSTAPTRHNTLGPAPSPGTRSRCALLVVPTWRERPVSVAWPRPRCHDLRNLVMHFACEDNGPTIWPQLGRAGRVVKRANETQPHRRRCAIGSHQRRREIPKRDGGKPPRRSGPANSPATESHHLRRRYCVPGMSFGHVRALYAVHT